MTKKTDKPNPPKFKDGGIQYETIQVPVGSKIIPPNTEMTHAERFYELMSAMPIDPEYEPVNGLPIPTGNGVLVKKVKQSTIITNAGIIIPGTESENSRPPHLGIIVALGPACSNYLKLGMKVYYNYFVDSSFDIGLDSYPKMHETDIFFICPPLTKVNDGVKPAKEVFRGKKMDESNSRLIRLSNADANDKDKRMDKTRGKIRPVSNK